MKLIDILSEGKKPAQPKTRSPAAASLADRKYQQKIIPNKKKKIDPKHKKAVTIDEAGGGARRAAIAIAKKKSGKYDKEGKRIKEGVGRDIGKTVGTLAGSEFGPAGRLAGGAIGGYMGNHAEEKIRSTFDKLHSYIQDLKHKEINERADDNGNSHCWSGYRKVGLKKKGGKYNKDGKRIKETSVAEQRSLAEPRIVQVGDDTQGIYDFKVIGPNHLSIYPFLAKQWNNEQHQARAKGYQLQYVGNDPAKAKAAAWPGETPKSRPMAVKEARKSAWDKMAGAVKSSTGKDLNKGDERAQNALKGLKKSAKDYQNVVDKDKKTNEGTKQKGVDGKACWDGYKRMGTKKKGGKTVDNCVPTGK
jgi:hypothetical protein